MKKCDIDAKLESVIDLWKTSGSNLQERRILFSSGIGENCIWSYGITSRYTFCFYLESPIQFGCGKQLCTKSIQSSEIKEGNIWFLQFELLEIMDLDIFAKLIKDLISESMKHSDDLACIRTVVARFEQWREMMSHVASHQAEEKGLWGELYLLREFLKHLNPMDVIRSWMGPEYEAQDYKFADKWIEVKTIGSNAFSAKISSLKQLNSSDVGYLYVIKADKDDLDESAESVHGLYIDINQKLKDVSIEASELFNDKIREFKYLGFVAEERSKYVFKGESVFEVTSDFPRVIPFGDSFALGAVTYELKLDALRNWGIEDIWQRL